MAETETPDRPMGIRGSKKRKATVPPHPESGERLVVDHGDDDDEGKKMEEFFALVNKFREARDRLACSRPASVAGEADRLHSVSAWDPRFRREDFMEEAVPMVTMETLAFGPSKRAQEGAENNGEQAGGGLDLRLSL